MLWYKKWGTLIAQYFSLTHATSNAWCASCVHSVFQMWFCAVFCASSFVRIQRSVGNLFWRKIWFWVGTWYKQIRCYYKSEVRIDFANFLQIFDKILKLLQKRFFASMTWCPWIKSVKLDMYINIIKKSWYTKKVLKMKQLSAIFILCLQLLLVNYVSAQKGGKTKNS